MKQIVIELSDELYDFMTPKNEVRVMDANFVENFIKLEDAIVNGTILPKGHGRLIDADNAYEELVNLMWGTGYQGRACNVLRWESYTPTIIEKDKEEENE